MIYKFKIFEGARAWADFKVDADTEAKARTKATKLLQQDVQSGSLVQSFTLELMENE